MSVRYPRMMPLRTGVTLALLALLPATADASRAFQGNYSTYIGPSTGWGWWAAAADLDGDGRNELLSIRQNSQFTQTVLQVRHGEPDGELASSITTYPLGLRDDLAAYLEPDDLDGDGHVDLVVASLDTVVILPGLAGGAFGAPHLVPLAGCEDGGVEVGDLNGDGIEDLVIACGRTARASILWGTGGLGFAPGPQFPTHTNPQTVFIADLNGDHLPDIVAGADSACTILLANGTGGFVSSEVPVSSVEVVADLNRDGIADLIGGDGVLLGHGDGTFGALLPQAVGAFVVAADLDEDGILDLAWRRSDGTDNRVNFQRGRGDGTFDPPVAYVMNTGSFTLSVADMDGDGHLDLISSGNSIDATFVLHGIGNGTFERDRSFATGMYGTVQAVGKLNGDATPDLVVASHDVRSLAVLRSIGPATYGPPVVYPLPAGQSLVRTGDLNGDGRDDVVAATDSSAFLSVWLTQPDGSPGPRAQVPTPGGVSALQLADLNLDGKLDVVYTWSSSSPIASGTNRILGDGAGGFGSAIALAFKVAGDLQVADLNGDGLPDLVGSSGSNSVRVALASATNVYPGFVDVPSGGGNPLVIRVGRWDADAIPDLLLFAGGIRACRGLGGGAFAAPALVPSGFGLSLEQWADVDGDGLDDIVAMRYQSAAVLHNNGDGSFANPRAYGTDPVPVHLSVADVNGDGRPDILGLSSFNGTVLQVQSVSVLLNLGSGGNLGVPPGDRPLPRLVVRARPNPAFGAIRLAFAGGSESVARIEVMDVAGRVVRTEHAPPQAREVTIGEGATLPAGLYFVRVRRGADTATARVCLMR